MKIEAHKVVQVSNIELAKDLVVAALKEDSCKIDVQSETSLEAKRGSQLKLRTIGGMLVGIKDFPVKISVEFTSTGDINQVDFSAFDDLGFGSKAGMTEKYEKAVLDILEVAVSSILPISTATATKSAAGTPKTSVDVTQPTQASKSFCSSCGSKLDAIMKFCSNCGEKI